MFISERLIRRLRIATRKKKDKGYEVRAIDGSNLPSIDSETIPLLLAF